MPSGGKTNLGNTGDRKALEQSLCWADGVLIGGETLRAHQSTCLIRDKKLIRTRLSNGRSKQPIAIVVSNQKDFCQDWPFFKQPIKRWLLNKSPEKAFQKGFSGYERHLYLENNWSKTLTNLAKKGITKIVILGGAKLALSLFESDHIDEIQLTITPKIIGGEYTWIPIKSQNLSKLLSCDNAWTLERSQFLGNSELLINYKRNI